MSTGRSWDVRAADGSERERTGSERVGANGQRTGRAANGSAANGSAANGSERVGSERVRQRTGQPDGSCWRNPPTRRSAPTYWRVLPFREHCLFRIPRDAPCHIPEMAYHVTQQGTNHQRVFFSASDRAVYLRLLQQNLARAETRVAVWRRCLRRIAREPFSAEMALLGF